MGKLRYVYRVFMFAMATWLTCITVPHAAGFIEATPIRIGILHSLTGTMAASEKPVADMTLLAIEQINAAGGLLGYPVEAVLADGKSDEETFAREAERLITEEHVSALFGCWTSASRKAVLPVIERHKQLLFYPVQYEGLEQSSGIIYTGAVPNQQILPAVYWAIKNFGSRIYLIGSDYVFPRAANWLIHKQATLLQGQIVGERYIPLGSHDMQAILNDIKNLAPDVILNTINGDSNSALFRALRQAGITAKRLPVISFSLTASGLQNIPAGDVEGHYAAWSYFQSLPEDNNQQFVASVHKKLGSQPVTDPMEAAWIGVQLWAQTVKGVQSWDPKIIRQAVLEQSLPAPEGVISVDPATRHLWKTARIAKINRRKQFDVVWSSGQPLRPFPYPLMITRHEGEGFLNQLKQQWHGRWSAPRNTQP